MLLILAVPGVPDLAVRFKKTQPWTSTARFPCPSHCLIQYGEAIGDAIPRASLPVLALCFNDLGKSSAFDQQDRHPSVSISRPTRQSKQQGQPRHIPQTQHRHIPQTPMPTKVHNLKHLMAALLLIIPKGTWMKSAAVLHLPHTLVVSVSLLNNLREHTWLWLKKPVPKRNTDKWNKTTKTCGFSG